MFPQSQRPIDTKLSHISTSPTQTPNLRVTGSMSIHLYIIQLTMSMIVKKSQIIFSAGEYKIISLIESGSQAKVYLAEKQNKYFCLKMYSGSQKNCACFENQCRILSKIQQNNVIGLIQICREIKCEFNQGDSQVHSFMVMKYCQGGDLKKLLNKVPFTPKIARTLMRSILGALRYISSKNIIHRDIKPQNIGVTENFDIKLFDFGWSIQGHSHRKQLVGTFPYIAPEVITKREYSQKSDLFSLGVIYYMMITGLYPFGSSKMTDKIYGLIMQKRFKQFWKISESKSRIQVDESVKRVIECMLAWKVSERISIEQIMSSEELLLESANKEELYEFFGSINKNKCEDEECNTCYTS